MRLIDADEFIKFMESNCDMNAEFDPIILSVCRGAVKLQPTAYDIDEVVEELEKKARRHTRKYTTPYGDTGYKDVKAISIKQAIEIVKAGGKND